VSATLALMLRALQCAACHACRDMHVATQHITTFPVPKCMHFDSMFCHNEPSGIWAIMQQLAGLST